jgi:hypothetical protein
MLKLGRRKSDDYNGLTEFVPWFKAEREMSELRAEVTHVMLVPIILFSCDKNFIFRC